MGIKCSACGGKNLSITDYEVGSGTLPLSSGFSVEFACIDCFTQHRLKTNKENYLFVMEQLTSTNMRDKPSPKKVYISGPMSGYNNFNRPAFNRASERIIANGNIPLNPAVLPDGLTQPEYMDICMAMLRCADEMLMLPDWEQSVGARAEYALGDKLGLPASYLKKALLT